MAKLRIHFPVFFLLELRQYDIFMGHCIMVYHGQRLCYYFTEYYAPTRHKI